MEASLLAAAGLQDCVDAGIDCMPGFDSFLLTLVGGLLVLLVWLPICFAASVDVAAVFARLGVLRALAFVLGIWLLPILGLVAWIVYKRSHLVPSELHADR